jgi:2Fe-2S ferredoxin
MVQLRPLKVGIVGRCNGNAECGTCHAFVREDWLGRLPEPDEFELEVLDSLSNRQPNSRLTCQIPYETDLDGLEITVATQR